MFGYFLYYKGSFINNNLNGKGILFYLDGNKIYEGNFNNNKIEGEGIKYYKNGSKKIEGKFNSINSCQGFYYSPYNEKIYEGEIINDIPINSQNQIITIYNDNTFKIYEGNIYKGLFEGQGIEYCPLVKDKILYKGWFSNNYLILTPKSKICKKNVI